jgi:hypothetical protein
MHATNTSYRVASLKAILSVAFTFALALSLHLLYCSFLYEFER